MFPTKYLAFILDWFYWTLVPLFLLVFMVNDACFILEINLPYFPCVKHTLTPCCSIYFSLQSRTLVHWFLFYLFFLCKSSSHLKVCCLILLAVGASMHRIHRPCLFFFCNLKVLNYGKNILNVLKRKNKLKRSVINPSLIDIHVIPFA